MLIWANLFVCVSVFSILDEILLQINSKISYLGPCNHLGVKRIENCNLIRIDSAYLHAYESWLRIYIYACVLVCVCVWERERETCLTESAISGPMPSPGKRVARIRLEPNAVEKKLRSNDDETLARPLGFVPSLRRTRLTIWEAMNDFADPVTKSQKRKREYIPLDI